LSRKALRGSSPLARIRRVGEVESGYIQRRIATDPADSERRADMYIGGGLLALIIVILLLIWLL
jgi:hypothetical protein